MNISLKHKVEPQRSQMTMDGCLAELFDEIQLAYLWERPSILLAIFNSQAQIKKAMAAFEKKLTLAQRKIMLIAPGADQKNVLQMILEVPNPKQFVFFVQNLGRQNEVYAGLNFFREVAVERQLKMIFWLGLEETFTFSRLAPDFWSFRHRTIEFPSRRLPQSPKLPSGVLIWDARDSVMESKLIDQQILFYEETIRTLSVNGETLTTHIDMIYTLAHFYWLKGDCQKSEELLRQELRYAEHAPLHDKIALLLNGLAINCYDQGNDKNALELTEAALRSKSDNEILLANHGVICRYAGRGGQSVKWVKKAIRLNPEASNPWGVLGYLLLSMGRLEDALASFEKAFSLSMDNFHYHLGVAVCHSKIGNHDLFKQALQSIPAPHDNVLYHTICMDGLTGNYQRGLDKIKNSVTAGIFPEAFVRRDPGLNMIFRTEELVHSAVLS